MFKVNVSKNTGLVSVEITKPSDKLYQFVLSICSTIEMGEEVCKIRKQIASFFQSKNADDDLYNWILIAFWSEEGAKAFIEYVNKNFEIANSLNIDIEASKVFSFSYNQLRLISKKLSEEFNLDESAVDYHLMKNVRIVDSEESPVKMIQELKVHKRPSKCLFCKDKCNKAEC